MSSAHLVRGTCLHSPRRSLEEKTLAPLTLLASPGVWVSAAHARWGNAPLAIPLLPVSWLPVGHTVWAEDHPATGLSLSPILFGPFAGVTDRIKRAGERPAKESALLGCAAHTPLGLDLGADRALDLAVSEVSMLG